MTSRHIVLFCAALLSLSGCSSVERPMLPAGKLRCAADTSSVEMTDLAEYIAADLGAELTLVQTDSESALTMLENNLADIALFLYPESSGMDPKFIGNITFAEKLVYCVHRGDITVTSVSDCAGLVMGASGELYDEAKKLIISNSGGGRTYCDNAEKAAAMLSDGTLDVYYCYSDEAEELLQNDDTLRCSQPADIPVENLHTAVLRSSEKLYSAVNCAIDSYLTERRQSDGVF